MFKLSRGLTITTLALFAAACNGGDDTDTGDTNPPIVDDTAPEVEYFEFGDVMIASFLFAYDAENVQARGFQDGVDALEPGLVLILPERSANLTDGLQNGEACFVEIFADGPQDAAGWVPAISAASFGFAIPSDADVSGDCDDLVDPADYTDFTATMAGLDWAVGIGPDVDPDYLDQLSGDPSFDATVVAGGGAAGDLGDAFAENGYFNGGLTYGDPVDESWIVDDSDEDGLTKEEMFDAEGNPQPAAYNVSIGFPSDFIDAQF